MSQAGPGPITTNVHQIGQTVAWIALYDITIVCVNLGYIKSTAIAHSIIGWCILLLTYIDILLFLIPNGFDVSVSNNSLLLYIHAILGLCMMTFIVLLVAGGVMTRLLLNDKSTKIQFYRKIRKIHKSFAIFLGVVYKINILWSWIPSWAMVAIIIIWEGVFVSLIINIKKFKPKLEGVIVDRQIEGQIRKIYSQKQLQFLTSSYVIFGNYVYEAKQLQKTHPGGPKVIQTIMGRQVDRFVYGMYSSQLFPELPSHSHSGNCLQLVGKPIAQLITPPTYLGFASDIISVRIGFVHKISQKTQIYELGLVQHNSQLVFKGYSSVQQLGQYYSFTINDLTTRLYTAVNFLSYQNIALMLELMPQLGNFDLFKDRTYLKSKKRQTQMTQLKHDESKGKMKQQLLDKRKDNNDIKNFLPLMLKIYNDGKLTSFLKQNSFDLQNLKLSCPRGRGLELQSTNPGRVIVIAGGTGLYPFCDIIDLLYKSQLLEQNSNQYTYTIKRQNPILESQPFSKFTFVFLIALNQPEDIHPITLYQLVHLSEHSKSIKIVMRISKNSQIISSIKSKIEFTRDYFSKRLLTEAEVQNLSRIWICGPPKLNSDTAASLIAKGYDRSKFLLV